MAAQAAARARQEADVEVEEAKRSVGKQPLDTAKVGMDVVILDVNQIARNLNCWNNILGRRGGFARISPWGLGGVGWGNTNPTSCYASGSLSMLLHELDGVG